MYVKDNKIKYARLCAALVSGLLVSTGAPGAHAALLQWTLQGVVFDDGGTASGSFVYDADTNTYSSIAITTTSGAVLPGQFYSFMNLESGSVDADSVLLVSEADPGFGTPAFNMNLADIMTNAGGSIDIAVAPPPLAFESTCLTSDCTSFFSVDRQVVSGFITTVVPVPGAWWLFGSALGAVGWLRRRSNKT